MLTFGLYLSLILEYVDPDSWVPILETIKLGTIVPLTVLFFAYLQQAPVSNGKLLSHANTKLLLVFLLLVTASVLTADVTQYSFKIFKNVLANIFWFIMIVKLATDYDKLKRVFSVIVFSHVVLVILNPSVVLEPESRSYLQGAPFLGDGNDFALSACITWPLCLVLIKEAKSKIWKAIYTVALVVLVLAIVGTQSRGGSLALAGTLMILWWSSERKAVHVVLIAIATIALLSFAPSQYFERMRTVTQYEEDGSARARIAAWKSGVRMVLQYPVTGVGAGHYPVALGREFKPPEWGDSNRPWITAHSMYFLVLGELGFPGIIVLLSVLIGNLMRLGRLKRDARGSPGAEGERFYFLFLVLHASLVGLCIGGAFLSVAYYPHLFVLSAFIVAATFTYEREILDNSVKSDNEAQALTRNATQPSRP